MLIKSKIADELELQSSDSSCFESFSVLIDSLNKEAGLNFIGELAVEHQIKLHLRNRKLILDASENTLEHKVSEPIFVIGLPRSGTTFLFNLLNKDQANRSPLFWEMMKPLPLVERNSLKETVRIFQSDLILFFKERFIPNLDDLHAIKSSSPEECLLIKVFALQSIFYFYMANTPSYLDYLSNCDTKTSYELHHKFLSVLEVNNKPERWLLKDPSHLGNIEEILHFYPDARFIHILRDPAETLPSICSLTSQVRRGFSKDIDLKDLGRKTLNFWEKSNIKNEIQKKNLPSNKYTQVEYEDLIDDPMGTIKDIYTNFSLTLKDCCVDDMLNYIDEGSIAAKAEHKYSLEDYGLDKTEVHNKLNYS